MSKIKFGETHSTSLTPPTVVCNIPKENSRECFLGCGQISQVIRRIVRELLPTSWIKMGPESGIPFELKKIRDHQQHLEITEKNVQAKQLPNESPENIAADDLRTRDPQDDSFYYSPLLQSKLRIPRFFRQTVEGLEQVSIINMVSWFCKGVGHSSKLEEGTIHWMTES
ncbi:hypothetical protein J6590_059782 [Homalodisca vitripennis]|nr:hypothetical protein J6590_059782 [Homalodisca vitripennis]